MMDVHCLYGIYIGYNVEGSRLLQEQFLVFTSSVATLSEILAVSTFR